MSASDYEILEYIGSTGSQYIDLGFSFGGTPKRVIIDFEFTSTDTNKWLFGFFGTGSVEAGIYNNGFYTGAKFTYSTASLTSRCIATSEFVSASSVPCYLFARNLSGDLGCCAAKIYSCTIETQSETVIHLVPAERKTDRELGVYDTVNDRFYVNSGSGRFYKEGENPHNYESVQAIIDAGTANMTVLVNNVGYDDNYYTISNPPSWLEYNGVIPTAVYASGNSWFGIGSTTEHIKFNRRDTKMWYLWSEEGTLYNYYRFYKLRWRGYAHYNQSYWLEWEVVFFETGDLMIRLVTQPSSYWDGSFNIVASQTYTYTKPTASSPYVSFYSQNQDNSVFQIRYELISIDYPSRWLIEDEGVFYNIEDGELNPLSITELTGDAFEEYGKFDVPDGSLLLPLTQPKLYRWNDGESGIQPSITAHLTAFPFPQTMGVVVDMSHETITGIQGVTAQYAGELTVCYSLDDGETYTEEEAVADFLNEDFTEIYEGLPASKQLYLRFVFRGDATLANVKFTFTN